MFIRKPSKPLSHFKIATFDCEAVKFNSETKEGGGSDCIDMLGFYDGKDYYCFKKGIDFIDYIYQNLEKLDGTYIYAHNFAGYDVYSFFDEFKDYYRDNYTVIDISGKFVEVCFFKKVKGKKFTVYFRDSFKMLPSALAKLGKSFGFPKTEQPPFDHKIYNNAQIGGEPYYKHMYKEVMKYNQNDCIILYNILKAFFEHTPYEYRNIPLTAPSLAFRVWSKMMKLNKCSKLTNAWEYDDFIRRSYAGGRTEVFQMEVEEDEYCYVDVNCYSEDTECWTTEGWKKYNEITPKMKVLTFNFKENKMEYNTIRYVHTYDYKGSMVRFKGEDSDVLVTPNHRIYHYSRDSLNKKNNWNLKNIKIKNAKDVHKLSFFKVSGHYYEGISYYKKEFIQLLSWIITEGHFCKDSKNIIISQSDHYDSEYINEIRSILKKLKIKYSEKNRGKRIKKKGSSNFNEYEFSICAKHSEYIRRIIPNKQIQEEWILNWNKKDLSVLFWTLMKGDGSFRKSKGKATYVSMLNSELDKMQIIATKIGIKSNINYKNNVINLKLNRGCNSTVVKSEEKYNGKVWCVTVDNSNLLVRRNGKICFQGNSLYPSEMEAKGLPVGQAYMRFGESNSKASFENKLEGFYEVEWTAPHDLSIPILWEKRDGRLIFPLNKDRGYKGHGIYTYPELKLAEENGYSFKFENCCVFYYMKNLFKEYVEYYKKMKFEGGAKKEIAKIFLNSVYGKLGQRTTVKSCVKLSLDEVLDYLEQGEEVTPVDLSMGLYNVTSKRLSENIIVAWASYITSYARITIWKNIQKAHFKVAYMDSVVGDSIIYTNKGYKKIEDMFDKNNYNIINGKDYCHISDQILTYDLNKNISSFEQPKYLMRHKVQKKGYIISLNNNEKLTITENHSIFTEENKELKVVKGEEILNINNVVTIKQNIKLFSKEVFDDWLKGLYYANGFYNKNYSGFSHKNSKYIINKCLKNNLKCYPCKKRLTDFYVKKQLGPKPLSLRMTLSEEELNIYINNINRRQSFLKGYWFGDGSLTTNKSLSYFTFSSGSLQILEQIQYLLFIDGYESSIVEDKGKNGFGSKNKQYILKILNSDSFINILKEEVYQKGTNYIIKNFSKNKSKNCNYNLSYRKRYITKIKEILINDYVYDFETINHTFCVKNILVHNTDSLVVRKEEAKNLWIDNELFGALKREYEVHKAHFFAPKFYIMKVHNNIKNIEQEILKIKGVHDAATKSIIRLGYEKAESHIINLAEKQEGIKTISFVQFKMSRKLLNHPRSGSSRVMIKQLKLDYAKRTILTDKIHTEPL